MGLFKKTKYTDKEVLKYSKDSYCIKDNYKDKDYFLRQLEVVNKRIDKYKTYFENGEFKDKNVYYVSISNRLLEKIELLNTLGESKENIKRLIEEYCDAVEKKSANLLTYNEVKNTLSLAYLYNLNIEKVEFIKENMLKDAWRDASLDILINGIFLNKPITSKKFCFKLTLSGNLKQTNGEFMNVVNAKNQEEINVAFVEYLKTTKESFYKRQLREYERLGEDRYTYTGSCDFTLTALAKMLNIDKSLLENSKFIATDLI